MQRSAARTSTRIMLIEPTARFFTDADINDWVDMGVRDICIKTFCLQAICTAITTSPNTTAYPYPTTCNATAITTIGIKTVLNSSNVSLDYISQDLIGRAGVDTDSMKWSDWARNIIISPVPTAGETITPLVWLVDGCTADETEFPIPLQYHHLVPLFCTYKGFQKRRDFAAAESVWRNYNAELQTIMMTLSDKFMTVSNKITIKDQSPVD